MEIKRGLSLTSVSGVITKIEADPLGRLCGLIDPNNPQNHRVSRKACGFDQISRPSDGTQDLFLEDTIEQPQFDGTPGDILNRGFLQADISLHGLMPSSGGRNFENCFLQGSAAGPNSQQHRWMTSLDRNIQGADGSTPHPLQDSQTVMLNLNWLI
jgi:hypothetical protein